ncbi:MAG: tRNA (adenosine(37)-N6)-threonylcarbamoyltransferase complex ATPase subunit type 1 TsaE [Bacteroidales bacterium]|nr:tRNA (adenosine(37)-N6)-threonylcarbamoyltransferase complex ATPase subunit type 1 TsaE [Bacteroidales bacterium]
MSSPDALESAAREFAARTGGHRLFAFEAPMGAGKTTFIAALCRVLGVDALAVSSPTFALVNEYRTKDGESIYHFDFYRIETPSEALDIGFYEYIDSGNLCLMEWPGNIAGLLPEETLIVRISVSPDGTRTLRWED